MPAAKDTLSTVREISGVSFQLAVLIYRKLEAYATGKSDSYFSNGAKAWNPAG
jgi:hypothetical protein